MALQAVGLKTSIWNNNIRSLFLVALYPLTLCLMVWAVAALYGGTVAYGGGDDAVPAAVMVGNAIVAAYWPAIFAVAATWFLIAGFFHTRMIRMLSHAHPVTREQEPELYNLLENLCISRGLPMPRLEVIETDARNAFASGVDRKSYAVTVTRGLIDALSPEEMEAVLGHELTHIMNGDVRLLIVSIIFTGMVGFICQTFWSGMRHGFYRSRGKKDARVMLFLMLIGLVLWVGYMATIFTRFALSRRREFMADAGSVELTKNPAGMMRALQRIAGADRIPDASADIALMCIENSQPFMGLFATHPPLEERIRAISELTGEPVPGIAPEQGVAEGTRRRNPWLREGT